MDGIADVIDHLSLGIAQPSPMPSKPFSLARLSGRRAGCGSRSWISLFACWMEMQLHLYMLALTRSLHAAGGTQKLDLMCRRRC